MIPTATPSTSPPRSLPAPVTPWPAAGAPPRTPPAPGVPPLARHAWDLLDAAGLLLAWVDGDGGPALLNAAWRAQVAPCAPGGHPARPLAAACATPRDRAALVAAYGALAAPGATALASAPLTLALVGADGGHVVVQGRLRGWWGAGGHQGVLAAFRLVGDAGHAGAAGRPDAHAWSAADVCAPDVCAPGAADVSGRAPAWLAEDPVRACVHDLLAGSGDAPGAAAAAPPADAFAMARAVAAYVSVDARRRGVQVIAPVPSAPAPIAAGGDDALPALAALLDRAALAAAHSPAGGRVVIRASYEPGRRAQFAVLAAAWEAAVRPPAAGGPQAVVPPACGARPTRDRASARKARVRATRAGRCRRWVGARGLVGRA